MTLTQHRQAQRLHTLALHCNKFCQAKHSTMSVMLCTSNGADMDRVNRCALPLGCSQMFVTAWQPSVRFVFALQSAHYLMTRLHFAPCKKSACLSFWNCLKILQSTHLTLACWSNKLATTPTVLCRSCFCKALVPQLPCRCARTCNIGLRLCPWPTSWTPAKCQPCLAAMLRSACPCSTSPYYSIC